MKMKHIALLAGAAVIALTACNQTPYNPTLADDAKTFDDSLTIASGQRLGYNILYELQTIPDSIDKKEMLRGAMDVINKVDTANMSYIYGLRMGQMLFMTYKDLAATGDVDKQLLINSMRAAFMSDSLPSNEEAEAIYNQFMELQQRAAERARQRAEEAIFASEAAEQNRMLADAVAEKLMKDPGYKQVGNDGVLMREVTPGTGVKPGAQDVVVVDVVLDRISGGDPISSRNAVPVFVSNPRDPMLQTLLPYMTLGQTAMFFVPYEQAFGIAGNEQIGVGPCESVMVTITMKPRETTESQQ